MTESIRNWMNSFDTMGQVIEGCSAVADGKVVRSVQMVKAEMSGGIVVLEPQLEDSLYYRVIAELMEAPVENDRELFLLLREYSKAKLAFDSIKEALTQAEERNYGIVAPKLSKMVLQQPEVFRQGSKFGVRLKAKAPCLHIIKTDITTEVSPVVGTESQSTDLARYLTEQFGKENEDIWETNLFGKSLREMVTEQMESKVRDVPDSLKTKVQKSLQKISDEGKDYFICIIL